MSYDRGVDLEAGNGDGRYHDDPGYQELLGELRTKLGSLEHNTIKLRSDVGLLGTRRDTARVRERSHALLEKCKEDCLTIGDGLKKLQDWDELSKQQKYERSKLATDFQEAVKEFQSVQRSALEKQKASVSAARAAHEGDEATSPGQQQQQQQLLLQEQEQVSLANQDEVDFQEGLIIEREEEIRNIEQGVGDLNVLFRQVAQIVSEQSNQVDTIAENVYVTRDETHGAMVETRQAARYQKAARKKGCFLLIILAIILTIVLLAILT